MNLRARSFPKSLEILLKFFDKLEATLMGDMIKKIFINQVIKSSQFKDGSVIFLPAGHEDKQQVNVYCDHLRITVLCFLIFGFL